MQPTYLPWAGLFNLMASVDVFIFLDDAQYQRSEWQNRNRVLVNGQPHWLTVPAQRESLSQMVGAVKIDDHQPWRKKHLRLLEQNYGKHPFGAAMINNVAPIGSTNIQNLSDLNITLTLAFASPLEVKPEIWRSSELNIGGGRSERLLKICQHFGCTEYLSPAGAESYLAEDGAFNQGSVKLSFQNFMPVPYPQYRSKTFTSHLSIVDVFANLGPEDGAKYIRGTYRTFETSKEHLCL